MPAFHRYALIALGLALLVGSVVLVRAETCETITVRRLLPTEPLGIETGRARYEFQVEVAREAAEKARGLMCRRGLPPATGMLFDFGNERPVAMWMKNTLIPLDMLFIRADGTIRDIARRMPPYSTVPIHSGGPVRFVLELAAGTATRLGIAPGDRITHALVAASE